MFKRTITTRSKANSVQENKQAVILPSFKRKAEKNDSEMNKRLALGDITNAKFKTKSTAADSKGAEFKKPLVMLGVPTTTKTTASAASIPVKIPNLTMIATDRNAVSAKAQTQILQAPVPVAISRNSHKNPVKLSSSSSNSSTMTSSTAATAAATSVPTVLAAKKTTLVSNNVASKVTIPLRTTAKLNTNAEKKRVVLKKIKPTEINKKTELTNKILPKATGLKLNPVKNLVPKPPLAKATAKTNNIQGRRLTNEFQKISLSQNKNCTVFKNDEENDEKMDEDENKENQKLLAKFEPVQRFVPQNVEDFDKSVMNDLYQAACYAFDIFEYLKENEIIVSEDYLLKQKEVTNKMRRLLVDWMVEIQDNFHLTHETLYLGVKIIDLYMSRNIISKDRLQILGTVALFLASKYEERNPPPVDDFVFICDGLYTKAQIYAQEMKVFKNIDFFLGYPLSYSFLRRFARCGKVSMTVLTLARYILESSLLEYQFISISDSKLAAASLFLALTMMHEHDKSSNSCIEIWTPTINYFTGYSEKQILPIALMLNTNLQKQIFMEPNFIKAKYSTELFYEVSKMKLLDNFKLEIN